jgi:hypothetical protein
MKTSSMCHLSLDMADGGEFLPPASHNLVADDNTAFGQNKPAVPQAAAEHIVEPDRVADDLGVEPLVIGRIACGFMPPASPACEPAARARWRETVRIGSPKPNRTGAACPTSRPSSTFSVPNLV